MADFDEIIKRLGACGICNKLMRNSKFVSLAQLDKKATWEYPVWNNVLVKGTENRAMAVVCDTCHDAKERGEDPGPIRFAIEVRNGHVVLHNVASLEDVSPMQELIKQTENLEELPGISRFFTGSVNDPRYGPFLTPKEAPVYWMHEQTGKMRGIVFKFMTGAPLSEEELGVMRWYVFQWVDPMPVKPEVFSRELIYGMNQEQLRSYVMGPLMNAGIDLL